MTGVQTCALPICSETYDDMVKQNTLDNSDASQFELSMQEKDGIYVEIGRASCRERV